MNGVMSVIPGHGGAVRRLAGCAICALLFVTSARAQEQRSGDDIQGISLLGDTLRDFPLSPETRARYEEQLAQARAAYDRAPGDADSIVWLGRRLAYVGRLREAIDVYSRGILLHPDNPWLYRHRGHRHITLREFDRAVADFELAALLSAGRDDEVEPDGQPNAENVPIGTLHSNIDYHLALAYYLRGESERALPVYARELERARNDDRRVSIAYWYYLALRRLARDGEAAALLAPITEQMNVIENDAYHRLLLMFKGEIPPDAILSTDAQSQMSVADATSAYGLASWHLINGRESQAVELFRRIIAGGQWPAFGYIAAEAELARR
ncbi:hypothetical protein BH23GEM2_BH23GEM2_17000 [soil metagenome]